MRLIALALMIVLACIGALPARAENRVALVIGNNAYNGGLMPLANPINDADLIADRLRSTGFEVEVLHDADASTTLAAVKRMQARLKAANGDGVGLFYFAGHGLQAFGSNYLMPVDARIASSDDIARQGIEADRALWAMLEAGARINILILDACRPNRVSDALRPVAESGLAELDANALDDQRSVMIAYSTGLGQNAYDGDKGTANSPYAATLAERMMTPDLPLEILFRNIRKEMVDKWKQKPWESNGMLDSFAFVGAPDDVLVEARVRAMPGQLVQITDFGAVPTHLAYEQGGNARYVPAHRYLKQGNVGVSLRDVSPPDSTVAFLSTAQLYEGKAFKPSISGNVLTQTDTENTPASFTLVLDQPASRVRFMIPGLYAATESGITFPAWRATALAGNGMPLSTVQDPMVRSFVDVPEKFFELRAPADRPITAIRFDSDPRLNGVPFTAFSAVLIEGLWVELAQ